MKQEIFVKSTNEFVGGSFYNSIVQATPSDVILALGKPWSENNDGTTMATAAWNAKTDCGIGFMVCDCEYYCPLNMDEIVDWHIGGKNRNETEIAANKLRATIEKKKAKELGLTESEYDAFKDIIN